MKFNAVGNDFLVVREAELPSTPSTTGSGRDPLLSRLASALCDRNESVGADGLLVLYDAEKPGNNARMRIFNADGSEAEMSGNGIRCAAACLILEGAEAAGRGMTGRAGASLPRPRSLRIETVAGVRRLSSVKAFKHAWTFRVGMGHPVLEPRLIPFLAPRDAPTPVTGFPLHTSRGVFRATITSMGNPHCSIFVDEFDAIDWAGIGQEIEGSSLFPNRTNVEFIRVATRRTIDVRFWERGVGTTRSSGTGSCAAGVAAILNGLTGRRIRVRTEAGALEVAWPAGAEVTLIGPVELVARGTCYCRV